MVLGLEADLAPVAEEALDGRLVGRLVVACERHDDVAVLRRLLAADDDVVVGHDPRFDHALALDPQEKLLPGPRGERLRDCKVVLHILLREERPARCDLANKRQDAYACSLPEGAVGGWAFTAQELERPRLGRVAADVPRPLQ